MKNTDYIIELAKGNMSLDGYGYITSLVKYYIDKYNWPKIILDENTNRDKYWTDDEILSFTQQFILFIVEKSKFKNYKRIPENYIEYYFKTIIVSYVANKIKQHQNKLGLSYEDTRRISLEILNNLYFSEKLGNEIFWNKENIFVNPIKYDETINDIVSSLPKIPITEKTRHYKPRVKTALNDLFNLINRPIKQSVIFNQVFKLFDQSSFAENNYEKTIDEIRESVVYKAIKHIVTKVDKIDIPILLEHFFSAPPKSLSILAKEYDLPKSTIHYKTNKFKLIISKSFLPENEQEGVWFLEKLHKALDEL